MIGENQIGNGPVTTEREVKVIDEIAAERKRQIHVEGRGAARSGLPKSMMTGTTFTQANSTTRSLRLVLTMRRRPNASARSRA
jgi:hypothetical protein